MPVTHEYPRYTADSRFGLTASPRCNILAVSDPVTRHRPLVLAGAAEDAIAWNPVTGQAARKFREEDDDDFADEEAARPRLRAGAVVARLAWHAGASALAVGYSDGWIRLYNLWTGELLVKFCGHKNAVSSMAFNADGSLLAAGGMDSDVTVLRIEGESGFRLQGHSNAVTKVEFLEQWSNCLLTASKDGLMKFWNLDIRVCFKTLTGHPGEIWDFALIGDARDLLVTGSCDNQLRLWRLSVQDDRAPEAKRAQTDAAKEAEQLALLQPADLEDALAAEFLGSVAKATKGRTHSLAATADGRLLCVASGTRGLEWFACPSSAEQRTRLKQRQRKAARKAGADRPSRLAAEDLLKPAGMLTGFPAKLRWPALGPVRLAEQPASGASDEASVDAAQGSNRQVEALRFECFVSLANNSILSYRLSYSDGAVTVDSLGSKISHGHEGPVRWATVSSDGLAVMTLSAGQLKLWRFSSLACLLTIDCPSSSGGEDQSGSGSGQMTRCVFLPGDRYAAVGTADGRLLLCDLSDGRVAEQLQAHSGPVTCLRQLSDSSGLISGSSGERQAMQWRYEISRAAAQGGLSSRLGLLLARSIALDDCLASVCSTPDARLLCCGLLDNSIRVLFTDSVRQFLHLHGHSQPASALAASSDSSLLASGSGDRTIRLWGLQFGDCQKILRGHDLAIADLAFVPMPEGFEGADSSSSSRLLVSCGADKCLRLWDAGKFRRVAALHGHQSAVACVAVAPTGDYFASVDQDGSVRTWQRTEEPLVLEEQRELEKDAQFEEEMAEQQAEATDSAASGLVSRLSLQSVRGAEALLAALERWETDTDRETKPSSAGVSGGSNKPLESLGSWLGRQPLHELEQAISALPAVHAKRLLAALDSLAAGGLQPERVCRCACLLLSFHFPCLAVSAGDTAAKFQSRLTACGNGLTDLLGFNLAALRILQSMAAEQQPDAPAAEAADGSGVGRAKSKRQKKRQKQIFDLRTV
ncbi:hypothetical protein BOX15_Mlig034069g3 [Macrostomum lignano]|uniref:Small-subunit processome Utp12 domain-containing protein n=1 Tax=Macrostomum lignano TaxID=282301 RepID=A0A267G732_9PLAT|nr:hypothetical protein BOX15_Mlig034069g3 [Macrostomum lignano]